MLEDCQNTGLRVNFGGQILHENVAIDFYYVVNFVWRGLVNPKPCLFEDLCKCFSTIYITTNIFIRSVSDDTMNFVCQIAYRNLVFSLNYSVLFVSSG